MDFNHKPLSQSEATCVLNFLFVFLFFLVFPCSVLSFCFLHAYMHSGPMFPVHHYKITMLKASDPLSATDFPSTKPSSTAKSPCCIQKQASCWLDTCYVLSAFQLQSQAKTQATKRKYLLKHIDHFHEFFIACLRRWVASWVSWENEAPIRYCWPHTTPPWASTTF